MRNRIPRLFVIGLPLALLLVGLGFLLTLTPAAASPEKGDGLAIESPMAVVNTCGAITTTTTWTPDNLYVADGCDVTIDPGVTLTLQGGTVAKFGGVGSALIVHGDLVVQGSQAAPVAITSLHDDDHGDPAAGSSGTPAAGDWYGLHFAAGSAGIFEHAFIGYAGSGAWNGVAGWNEAQIRVVGADLSMQHSTVDSGLTIGIYFEGANLAPTLQDVQIGNNSGATTWPYSSAVLQDTVNMQPTYSDLTFSGNDTDAVVIWWNREVMQQDVTLGATVFSFICGYTDCPLVVPSGRTLTLAPGAKVAFPHYSYRLIMTAGSTLLAEGTPTQPITFTSILTTPQPGNWQGIVLNNGATARLANCDVSYGGANSYGGLQIESTDVQVSDCHIHHHATDGIDVAYRDIAPTFTDVTVTDNEGYGVQVGGNHAASDPDTQPLFEGGFIERNALGGVAMQYETGHRPTLRGVEINDNGGDGVLVASHLSAPVLENVTLNGNSGAAVSWWAGTSPTFLDLSASGNGVDALINTGGDIWGGSHWGIADAGLPVYLVGNTRIQGGALLSIEPGTTLILTPTVYLKNTEGGSLYALGTPERPITFTGVTPTPGAWGYIDAWDSTLFLSHCTVEYGGAYAANGYAMINSGGSKPNVVQNCRLHRSLGVGYKRSWGDSEPLLRNNAIYSNTTYGVLKTWGPSLDARYNWWGDASGPYHPTQNPGGQGDAVGEFENVIFQPWLTAPPTQTLAAGGMVVDTGAPSRVSPGQTASYAIQYMNGLTQTVENGVLMMQLPVAAEYVDSSGGGIYWAERGQVFWRLGDLAPGDSDLVTVRVRFQWGLPADYQDGTITLLEGSNYPARQPEIEISPYLTYQEVTIVGQTPLSVGEFATELGAYPALQMLYDQALADNYSYHSAAHVERSDGQIFTEAILIGPDLQSAQLLTRNGDGVLATTLGPTEYSVQDTAGGVSVSLLTGEQSYWGSWAAEAGALDGSALLQPTDCGPGACKRNCIGKLLTLQYLAYKGGRVLAWTAFSIFSGGATVPAAIWEVGSVVVDIHECTVVCDGDPSTHCCTAGQVRWSKGWWSRLSNTCPAPSISTNTRPQ